MALTRIRAQQISDIDYKQSVRAVTTTNITLAGGAPSTADSVSLAANDRVLVTGQTTGSQNGLYYVTTLGNGSNGTWTRSADGDTTGEIDAGLIVMVTEGTVYADTQWKLTTNDPITVGTTALTFVQNYLANSISAGTSNVTVGSSGNVTISSAGTANVLTVSSTGTVVSGTESVTGNVTGGNILTAGLISATGNIQGGNLRTVGLISATGAITGASVVGGVITGTSTSVSGTTTAASTVGGVITGTSTSVTGTQSAASTVGGVITGSSTSVTGTTTAASTVGGVITGSSTSVSGTTTAASVVGGVITGTSTSVTGTTTAASVVGGVITGTSTSVTGNITASFFLGNGSALTGITASGGSNITNGTSNVSVAASGNVTVGVAGTANVMTVSSAGVGITGTLSASGNVSFNQTIVSISANTTASNYTSYVLTASLTLTLPASPSVGNWVNFTNRSNTTTCVLARNSSNIMGLSENMNLNTLNSRATMAYTGASQGWVIMNE